MDTSDQNQNTGAEGENTRKEVTAAKNKITGSQSTADLSQRPTGGDGQGKKKTTYSSKRTPGRGTRASRSRAQRSKTSEVLKDTAKKETIEEKMPEADQKILKKEAKLRKKREKAIQLDNQGVLEYGRLENLLKNIDQVISEAAKISFPKKEVKALKKIRKRVNRNLRAKGEKVNRIKDKIGKLDLKINRLKEKSQ